MKIIIFYLINFVQCKPTFSQSEFITSSLNNKLSELFRYYSDIFEFDSSIISRYNSCINKLIRRVNEIQIDKEGVCSFELLLADIINKTIFKYISNRPGVDLGDNDLLLFLKEDTIPRVIQFLKKTGRIQYKSDKKEEGGLVEYDESNPVNHLLEKGGYSFRSNESYLDELDKYFKSQETKSYFEEKFNEALKKKEFLKAKLEQRDLTKNELLLNNLEVEEISNELERDEKASEIGKLKMIKENYPTPSEEIKFNLEERFNSLIPTNLEDNVGYLYK